MRPITRWCQDNVTVLVPVYLISVVSIRYCRSRGELLKIGPESEFVYQTAVSTRCVGNVPGNQTSLTADAGSSSVQNERQHSTGQKRRSAGSRRSAAAARALTCLFAGSRWRSPVGRVSGRLRRLVVHLPIAGEAPALRGQFAAAPPPLGCRRQPPGSGQVLQVSAQRGRRQRRPRPETRASAGPRTPGRRVPKLTLHAEYSMVSYIVALVALAVPLNPSFLIFGLNQLLKNN